MIETEMIKLVGDAQLRLLTIADVVVTVTEARNGIRIEADGIRFALVKDYSEAALLLQTICLITQKTKLKTLNKTLGATAGPYIGIVT